MQCSTVGMGVYLPTYYCNLQQPACSLHEDQYTAWTHEFHHDTRKQVVPRGEVCRPTRHPHRLVIMWLRAEANAPTLRISHRSRISREPGSIRVLCGTDESVFICSSGLCAGFVHGHVSSWD